MRPVERAARAADACVARFGGKAFDPASNRDCVKLIAHCLHQQGIATPKLKGLKYTTFPAGLKALRKLGFKDLVEAVDDLGLEPIPLARALPGHIIAVPCDEPEVWGAAMGVCVGQREAFGFFEGVGQSVMLTDCIKAWRTF